MSTPALTESTSSGDSPVELAPRAPTSVPLDDAGCRAVLRQAGWGVLSVVEGETLGETHPYAVPVGYAFDEEALYVATRPGRKLQALERHPIFCLTVLEVERFDRWRSVVLTGRPHWLHQAGDRAMAIRAFAGQRRPGSMRLTRRDTERLLAARVMRMDVREITGRACGVWESPPALVPEPVEAVGAEAVLGAEVLLAEAHQLQELAGSPADEAARLMDGLRRLVRSLYGATSASTRELGVSAAQLFVLRQIAAHPAQSIGELASRTRTTQSSVSEVVARLTARGLVERRPAREDRRRAELTLTSSGRSVIRRAPDTVQERMIAGFGRLPEPRRQALVEGMEAWLAESGLGDVPPTMFFESTPDEEPA